MGQFMIYEPHEFITRLENPREILFYFSRDQKLIIYENDIAKKSSWAGMSKAFRSISGFLEKKSAEKIRRFPFAHPCFPDRE